MWRGTRPSPLAHASKVAVSIISVSTPLRAHQSMCLISGRIHRRRPIPTPTHPLHQRPGPNRGCRGIPKGGLRNERARSAGCGPKPTPDAAAVPLRCEDKPVQRGRPLNQFGPATPHCLLRDRCQSLGRPCRINCPRGCGTWRWGSPNRGKSTSSLRRHARSLAGRIGGLVCVDGFGPSRVTVLFSRKAARDGTGRDGEGKKSGRTYIPGPDFRFGRFIWAAGSSDRSDDRLIEVEGIGQEEGRVAVGAVAGHR